MHKWLGLVFLFAGLLSFYQSYLVLLDRDAVWEKEKQYHHSHGQIPKRTQTWDREQLLQAPWWVLGGVSGVLFGLWLLVVLS